MAHRVVYMFDQAATDIKHVLYEVTLFFWYHIWVYSHLELLKDVWANFEEAGGCDWADFFISHILATEIEQVSSLFQEKQAELQSAVLKVEQLSLQLEDLRKGKLNGIQTVLGGQVTGAAALELRKLYQELQVLRTRNKRNM